MRAKLKGTLLIFLLLVRLRVSISGGRVSAGPADVFTHALDVLLKM